MGKALLLQVLLAALFFLDSTLCIDEPLLLNSGELELQGSAFGLFSRSLFFLGLSGGDNCLFPVALLSNGLCLNRLLARFGGFAAALGAPGWLRRGLRQDDA